MTAPLTLIAGPCVLETRELALEIAGSLAAICRRLGIDYVFKASFDKANRSSGRSFRGPGLEEGLAILADVRERVGVPVLTDIHESHQAAAAAEVVDVLQIPAFLCRQTDLLLAAAEAVAGSDRIVNIKKGQFLAPWDMAQVVAKLRAAGLDDPQRLWLTERGTSFGYNTLVVDYRSLPQLQALGCELVDVSCPRFNDGIATYYVIAPSEASANLARYDGVKYGLRQAGGDSLGTMTALTRASGFGAEVQRRILIGTYALSAGYVDAFYRKALQVRTLIRQDFDRAFADVDLLLTPTAPTTAFRAGDHADDPLALYLADLLTIPANLAGLPAISVPCGFDSQGLPIGLQLMAPVLAEERLLQVAHRYETTAGVMGQRPTGPLAI